MKKHFVISFHPLRERLAEFTLIYAMSDFFSPNLFIDCVLERFVEMYHGSRKGTPVAELTCRDLVLFVEMFGDNYDPKGNANVEALINEIHQHRQEIAQMLNKIMWYFLEETDKPGVVIADMVRYNSCGLIYGLEMETDEDDDRVD